MLLLCLFRFYRVVILSPCSRVLDYAIMIKADTGRYYRGADFQRSRSACPDGVRYPVNLRIHQQLGFDSQSPSTRLLVEYSNDRIKTMKRPG